MKQLPYRCLCGRLFLSFCDFTAVYWKWKFCFVLSELRRHFRNVKKCLILCCSCCFCSNYVISLSVLAAMQQAMTVTPAPRWCTAAARSTAYTHMESSGAFRWEPTHMTVFTISGSSGHTHLAQMYSTPSLLFMFSVTHVPYHAENFPTNRSGKL